MHNKTLLTILLFFICLCGCEKKSAQSNIENNNPFISAQEDAVQEENIIVTKYPGFRFLNAYSLRLWQDENGNSKYTFISSSIGYYYSGLGITWAGLENGLVKESFVNDSLDELIKISSSMLNDKKIVVINGWTSPLNAEGKKKETFTPKEIMYIRNKYKLLSPETKVYEFRYVGK